MRILFVTGSSARYMSPPRLGAEQINCGPDWADREICGNVMSLSTPAGEFDLSAVASRIPQSQKPDAIVCLVDAAWRCLPRNLRAFRCPKILLVADTHHLKAPVGGMIRYAQSEPFDRVVLLYDRHHWEFFAQAGIDSLFWLPGLTFPHSDSFVQASRTGQDRAAQLAFVGQTGLCHPRRTQMLSELNARGVPLSVRALSQREAMGFYGTSLAGFNASLNGDLNLRVIEILASGAALLTDRLSPASGLTEVWREGQELVTYASPSEMSEKARWLIDNPAEARRIGEAGAAWFDLNYSERARIAAFEDIVHNGRARPEFALQGARTFSSSLRSPQQRSRLIAGFEFAQELHRNLETVTVALGENAPEEFAQMCGALPRLSVIRTSETKATRADLLVVDRTRLTTSSANLAGNIWVWDAVETDRPTLVRLGASRGLTSLDPENNIFCRRRINTHTNDGAVALALLEQGAYEDALARAKSELLKNPRSVDALLVLADLAQEQGNREIAQSSLSQLQALAPNHPRFRELAAAQQPQAPSARKAARLAKTAHALLEQKDFVKAQNMAMEALGLSPSMAEAYFVIGRSFSARGSHVEAITYLSKGAEHAPYNAVYWYELGRELRAHASAVDALGAAIHAAELSPDLSEYQLALAETALEAEHGHVAVEALERVLELLPGYSPAVALLEAAQGMRKRQETTIPRNLLLSHVEVNRLQGTGVLLNRFFPDASDFVTLRSRSLYKGVVHFGGRHLALHFPGLKGAARTKVVRRLLTGCRIDRILCVPFFETDFLNALAAAEVTDAPLCTYAMDDQVMYSKEVSGDIAQAVFARSRLRLAISPEMIHDYSSWFKCSFGLLPPIITTQENEVSNQWSESDRAPKHCAMVGNVWSAKQFEQLRAFSREAELHIDWFGNSDVAWLPQDRAALEADGIYRCGFLPENQLAERLATYPFVIIPSGTLDGTEDNEWLTRLSLPSRMVFILTKTQTPMLVLGSVKTAAAQFVQKFGLGTSSNYSVGDAREKIAQFTSSARRSLILESARAVAPCFLMPNCGSWIWDSLRQGRPGPTPFDGLYALNAEELEGQRLSVTAAAGIPSLSSEVDSPEQRLLKILLPLGDAKFLDGFLPPEEPRQRLDVRGGVLYLHNALQEFASTLDARLVAVQQLALKAPQSRHVLVVWAELLELAGDRPTAAAKARQALSLYYDDVYTQTVFVRCAGEKNFHADAKDRFCPAPFGNFEIYKDGSVFPCNCTQVPFPIGNAYKQTADEIWHSKEAKTIRGSILDGSFRYCSPMTCWRRFDLPKRSEHPELWARVQKVGAEGTEAPNNLNLSYDLSCNLSCPSCRNAQIMATGEERKKLEHVRDNVVLPLLSEPSPKVAYITGSGDAFGSPHFRGILKELCDPKYSHVEITLGTNGQLITERLWEEFKPLHPRFKDITISIDGATPETFERLRRGSTWDKLLRTMGILREARRTGAIRRVMVNMVVQEQNFLEMRPLLYLCKDWLVDGVRFYRIRQWGNVDPFKFMASDVANSLHHRHAELLAELAHPIFTDPIVDHYDMYALILQAQELVNASKAASSVKASETGLARAVQAAGSASTPKKTVRPLTLNLQAIDVCNSRCVMCNIWKDGKKETLDLAGLRKLLSTPFYSEVTHVGVTGGEPTLRRDLVDLYRMLPECLPSLTGASFITHGMQTEKTVEIYSQVHAHYAARKLSFEGMVSLDGVGAVHDRVRGRAGAFEGASKTLLQLKAKGIPVMAACTIVRINVYELHDLLDWGKAHGVYVRFRVAEFIRRLYNSSCAAQIRSFDEHELRHLVCFFHVLLSDYEKDATIQRTYRSILSILTGGERLVGCPYKDGRAVNVDSRGGLAACAPKGTPLPYAEGSDDFIDALEQDRVQIAANHCASCIHDYHAEWTDAAARSVSDSKTRVTELYGRAEEDLATDELPAARLDLKSIRSVLMTGWYGTETAGDIAILQGIVMEYLAQNPGLTFQVLSRNPYYTRSTLSEWPKELGDRMRVVDEDSEEAWLATRSCDAIVMAGGPLMDIPETRKVLCLFKLFAEMNKARIIEGCGVGPLNRVDLRWHVIRIARLATRIAVRDRDSRDLLRAYGIKKEVEVRADPAVTFLRAQKVAHHGKDSGVIRCFFRELTSEYPQSLNAQEAFESLKAMLLNLLNWYPDKRIELWSMHHFPVGQDDRLFARELVRAVGNPRLVCEWVPRTPREIMEAMAAAEFCVCMRFHSCVFATEVGVPFLAVDYTAGGKIQAMLEDTGQECRCARLSDLPGIGKEDFERKVFFKADSPDSAKQSVAKRVLHLLPRVTGGGGARAAIWMARDSKKSGGPDHLVVSLDAADETGLAVASENRVEVMDRPSAGQLRRALEEADIVVAHWWNCPQFAQLFSRELPPMRLMIWLHVAGYHAPQLIRPELLRFADMAIACSPHTYAHPAFDALSASERNDRTAMILAGADFSRLHGAVPRLHSGFNVGYIGTLDPVKMHPDFVEMSHGVKIADVRFTVCGNGDAQWLRDRAKKLGSLERFDIRGSVSNIREVIEEMDVYGYPLCPETYAAAELNLQEVMYAGVPVVAFPHGGIARLIEHGQTGLLVNSPEEYAAAIEFLHANPQERTRIGGNAAEYARRHWGSEAAARAFNIQFERITKEPKRARVLTDSNVADTSLSSLPRDLALSPGARLFIESLGSAAEPFLQSALSSDWKVALAADERLAASSHLMRYNGIASFAEAFTRDAFLLFWMGLVQMKEGNNQQAAGFLSESIRHGFAHPRAKLHLATIAVRENRLEDAGKLVREVLRFAPTLPQIAELQQSIAAKIAKSPQENTPKRHLQRTMQFLKEGNPSQARQALGRALELAPHDLSLMELACELDCALQEFASARRLLRMITIRDPQRQSTRLVTIRGVLSRVDAAPVLPAAAGGAAAETTSTMAPTP